MIRPPGSGLVWSGLTARLTSLASPGLIQAAGRALGITGKGARNSGSPEAGDDDKMDVDVEDTAPPAEEEYPDVDGEPPAWAEVCSTAY
jgi:hypothetical protein